MVPKQFRCLTCGEPLSVEHVLIYGTYHEHHVGEYQMPKQEPLSDEAYSKLVPKSAARAADGATSAQDDPTDVGEVPATTSAPPDTTNTGHWVDEAPVLMSKAALGAMAAAIKPHLTNGNGELTDLGEAFAEMTKSLTHFLGEVQEVERGNRCGAKDGTLEARRVWRRCKRYWTQIKHPREPRGARI